MKLRRNHPGKSHPDIYHRLFTRLFFPLFLLLVTFQVKGQSVYTQAVFIPNYDAANSEHFLIRTTADWSHINDSDKRCFYVKPEAGCATTIITADGRAEAPRSISLHNRNDTHPAQLTENEQANVRLVFNDAHYWVVDRMSSIDYNTLGCGFIIENNSGNIILNRLHLTGFFDGVGITGTNQAPYTSDITIQNCRFDQMTPKGIDGDAVAIILTGGPSWNTPGTIVNTKILNNEIKNCNDGIQTLKMPQFCGKGNYYVDYPGTIIDANHIYVDSTLYTDGNGSYDPDGLWALTENAIDLKGGSSDPNNPMIISNNYMWGYRRTDTIGGGSGSWGGALCGHYHVENLKIENNVLFDSNQAIAFSDTYGTTPYSIENGLIRGNIIYNIGFDTKRRTGWSNLFFYSKNVSFVENTIIGVNKPSYSYKQSRWFTCNESEENLNVSGNLIIDSHEMTGKRAPSTSITKNTFYNTDLQQRGDGEYLPEASEAKLKDLVFTTDRLTNAPRTIILERVVSY